MATQTDRGVSPVIGTVLLIGLTVTLAATTAAFVLAIDQPTEPDLRQSLAPDSESDTPEATFDFAANRGTLTIEHTGGDALAADRLYVRGDGLDTTWAASGEVTKGDSRTVTSSGPVRVVYDGETLAEYEP